MGAGPFDGTPGTGAASGRAATASGFGFTGGSERYSRIPSRPPSRPKPDSR